MYRVIGGIIAMHGHSDEPELQMPYCNDMPTKPIMVMLRSKKWFAADFR